MKNSIKKFFACILSILLLIDIVAPVCVFAKEKEGRYNYNEVVNAGKDTGYTKTTEIKRDDPHYNWSLGSFIVGGFSAQEKSEEDTPVFLKNEGDKITLWFRLDQNIKKLNGDKNLKISEDKNGYDEYFKTEKQNFGKGTLIIRHTDSENEKTSPTIYTNYLEANTSKDAITEVVVLEEGDYEVALDYEIKESSFAIFGWEPIVKYHNYRIFFEFSVRNGNCIIFPRDVKTQSELTNEVSTENGFFIDMANSKYLDVIVKKEVLNEGSTGLVEDTRFNRPAKDGEQFTEEGIYTITATNNYTDQSTQKKIYVGTNDVLKAHVATGFTVEEINNQLSLGATISENGKLISPENKSDIDIEVSIDNTVFIVAGVAAVVVVIIVVVVAVSVKKKKRIISKEDEWV